MATRTKAAAPGGGPPNRLTPRTRWAVKECGPMLYHLAGARGVHPSQVSRELSGERRSAIAEVEEICRAYVRERKCDPSPIITRFLGAIEEEWLAGLAADPWSEYRERCDAVLSQMGATLDAQLRARECHDAASLDTAEEELSRQAARTIRLVGVIPIVRRSLS